MTGFFHDLPNQQKIGSQFPAFDDSQFVRQSRENIGPQ